MINVTDEERLGLAVSLGYTLDHAHVEEEDTSVAMQSSGDDNSEKLISFMNVTGADVSQAQSFLEVSNLL